MITDWLLKRQVFKYIIRIFVYEWGGGGGVTHSADRPFVCVYGKKQLKKFVNRFSFKTIKTDIRN